MMHNPCFKMPNELIVNTGNLQPSAIGVAAVLYAYMNRHRSFTNSIQNIAKLACRCEDTVCQAVEQLEQEGFIKRLRNYAYRLELGRNVFAQTTYRILRPVEKDYTLIPYSWVGLDMSPCAYQTLLACRMYMIKDETRAYPSLRKISGLIRIAKSTVCNAMKRIGELGILVIEHCKKENGAYTSNSYHMVKRVVEKAAHLFGRRMQPLTGNTDTEAPTQGYVLNAAPFLFENSLAQVTLFHNI